MSVRQDDLDRVHAGDRTPLSQQVSDVVERIPDDHYRELTAVHPLQANHDLGTVLAECAPFADWTGRTDAVYVLECTNSPGADHAARAQLGLQHSVEWPREASTAERRLYVGVSNRVAISIWQHVAGVGADFCAIFPPARILDLSFYDRPSEARHAAAMTAEMVRERFPEDYVAHSERRH
ncbi:hypothetical protein SAMN04487948_13012 [Halogranum amylolyticum]|uniref:Uncharacterized protein n=1 Tax=Halogranum amylolyticum TaxID=660520 RepID=A0A1H8WHK0_9EURY|nr:hypothetical protein [Halogranum amylolyticum]SEP27121.1 hypothetical protein SAMN04487948_13012 [Halogranum amylolyticum]